MLGLARTGLNYHVAAGGGGFTRDTITITPSGNTKISTDQSKFGGASAYFDGVNDHLTLATTNTYTGDFTWEGWARSNTIGTIVTNRSTSNTSFETGTITLERKSDDTLGLTLYDSDNITSSATSDNIWFHWAIVRSSGVISLYLNGVSQGTSSNSAEIGTNNHQNIQIGTLGNDVADYGGYVDEIRISSIARYTSNFTPATAAFTNDADTIVLCHCDGENNSTTFTDDVSGGGGGGGAVLADWANYSGSLDGSYTEFVDNNADNSSVALGMFDDTYGVVFYRNGATNDIYYRQITISGTGISYGTATDTGVDMDNLGRVVACRLSSTRIVLACPRDANVGQYGVAVLSGSSVSVTATDLTSDTGPSSVGIGNSIPTVNRLSDTTFALTARRSGIPGYITHFSVNTGTNAVSRDGTSVLANQQQHISAMPISSTKVMVTGQDQTSTAYNSAAIYDWSGSAWSINGSNQTIIDTTGDVRVGRNYTHPNSHFVYFDVQYDASAQNPSQLDLKITPVQWTGSAISVGSTLTITDDNYLANVGVETSEYLRDIWKIEVVQPDPDNDPDTFVAIVTTRQTDNYTGQEYVLLVLDYDSGTNAVTSVNSNYVTPQERSYWNYAVTSSQMAVIDNQRILVAVGAGDHTRSVSFDYQLGAIVVKADTQ